MILRKSTAGATGLVLALTLATATSAAAQTDTTQRADSVRRAQSEMRIPVRKEGGFSSANTGLRTRVSAGEVDMMLSAERARIDSLEASAAMYRTRIDSISTALGAMNTRDEELARNLTSLQDSLRLVRTELVTVNTRTAQLSDSLQQLNARWQRFRNGSLFNNSGFYVGVGTGANFTTGTLQDIGYHEGLNIAVPIGFHRPGTTLGLRAELGFQSFDGRAPIAGFNNEDPEIWSAVGMVTLHFPFNQARTNNFYLMGGGGAYMFRDIGGSSTLAGSLDEASPTTSSSDVTKFGVTGGAGLEFRILGPASIFVQSRFTNVFGEENARFAGSGKNLQWVPLVAGITLR